VNFLDSLKICVASSLVGASTKADGYATDRVILRVVDRGIGRKFKLSLKIDATIGIKNAAVLPEPILKKGQSHHCYNCTA